MTEKKAIHSIKTGFRDADTGEEIMPGWYFWDESWAYRHGPFSTYKECADIFRYYCESL